MDLSHLSFLQWLGVGLLWLTIGYQVSKLSLEVYDKWGIPDDGTLGTWVGLRLITFPINCFDMILVKKPEWIMVDAIRNRGWEGGYLFWNMFMWPFRTLVWSPVMIVIFFALIPIISLIIAVTWRIIRDSFFSLKRLFTNQSPNPSSNTEPSAHKSF